MKYVDHKTQFAWKDAPFGKARKVPPFEAERWPRYQRRRIATAKRRDWTHEEVDRLVNLLDAGLGYAAIARQLRRSEMAVKVKVKRVRAALTKRPTMLTARQVADLMGVPCSKTVSRWIAMDWLKAKAVDLGRADGRKIWRIAWDDVAAFLERPEGWVSWLPERIVDEALRERALTLRHERLLTQSEVAQRMGVGVGTVGQWLDKGFLPARRYGARGNRFVPESALDGWMPPCMRSKAGIPKRAGRAVVGRTAIVSRPL